MTEATEAYRKSRIMVKRTARLTAQDKMDIIKAYEIDLEPMMSIATRYGKSRSAIRNMLKKAGVNTSKRKIAVSCATCGATIHRPKCQIRNRHNNFCSYNCYYSFLEAGSVHLTATEQRRGNKRARVIVENLFDLQPEHVVHHEDQFQLNNQKWNLRVFASQGDHIRYHHKQRDIAAGGSSRIVIEPIWDGSKINR